MRKHFLILMLMALLPLAGWAAVDISTLWVATVADITYGQAKPVPTVTRISNGEEVASNNNWAVAYYSDAECTVPATAEKLNANATNSSYYLKITPTDTENYTGSIIKSFKVGKANLTYTLQTTGQNAVTLVSVYKKHASTFTKTFTLDNIKIEGKQNNESDAALFTVTNGTWDYANSTTSNANFDKDGVNPLTANDPGYLVTLQGITPTELASTNYNISYVNQYVKIKQAVISFAANSGFTVSNGTEQETPEYTYNGNQQNPTYVITYTYGNGQNDKETLTLGSGFTATYKDGNQDVDIPFFPNDDFNAYVNTVSNTNYVADEDNDNLKLGTFKINKMAQSLALLVTTKSLPYNGQNQLNLGDAVLKTSTLAQGDRGLTVTFDGAELVTEGDDHPDALAAKAQTYYVRAKKTDNVTIHKNNADWKLTDLYDVSQPEAEWTITKIDLGIAAKAAEITYGQAVSDITKDFDVTGAVSDDETNAIKNLYTASLNTTTYAEWATNTYKPARDTYADAIVVARNQTNDDTGVLDNYNISDPTSAAVTVKGANFIIIPDVNPTYQYGTAVTPGYSAYNDDYSAADVEGTVAYQYKVFGAADNTYTSTAPTAIGKYTVKASGLTGKGNNQGGTATFDESDFEIQKKTLNVKVKDLELWEGATLDILKQKAELTANIQTQAAYNEEIKLVFSFNETTANLTVNHDAQGNQTDISFQDGYDANGVANAILVALDADDENSAHYTLMVDEEGGKLTKTNTAGIELELDGTAASVTKINDAIALIAANPDVTYDVKLKTNRKLYGGYWNFMVLPFSVTPMEFITAINGYAVFNTLKSANVEKNTVSFSLNIDEIPANTPFLVKPVENVNFTTTANNVTTYLTFAGQKIESTNLVNGVPTYTNIAKVHFIGTYVNDTQNNGGSNVLYAYAKDGKPTIGPATNNGEAAAFTYPATSAILELSDDFAASGNAPVILIEEADGSTTVIRNINAEGVAVPAEGWYNLNGVKLQGAPTEKGIYINNGKKVIIK